MFVKAVGAELNVESPVLHRREAIVSAALPASSAFPVLLDTYDDGAWVALAFEAIDGGLPKHPWERAELLAVLGALEEAHDMLTPSPASQIEPAAVHFQKLLGGWAELAGKTAAPGLAPWSTAHLSDLAELEARWPDMIEGPTLMHGDIRSDNILLGPAGPVFIDWPHAAVGTPVFDLVAWAPSVVLEGGPQPEELLAGHRPSRSVDPEVVTVLLAAISGFMVSHSLRPPPPGSPDAARVPGGPRRGGRRVVAPTHGRVATGAAAPFRR